MICWNEYCLIVNFNSQYWLIPFSINFHLDYSKTYLNLTISSDLLFPPIFFLLLILIILLENL